MPKECAFCPTTADITGEHIWSDWINRLLSVTHVTFRKLDNEGSTLKQWFATELNMKPKVVCAKCNNTWMSDIESKYAKPAMVDLILGNRIGAIGKKRAYGLSLFAFKTAVIVNRSLPESEFFFEESDRYAFHRSLTLPRDVGMWLVCMEPAAILGKTGGGIMSVNVKFPNKGSADLTLNVCSFWVGRLGFQVISAKSQRPRKLESLPFFSDLTVSFYPTLEPNVRWPRDKFLLVHDFSRFWGRWNSVKMH